MSELYDMDQGESNGKVAGRPLCPLLRLTFYDPKTGQKSQIK